MEEALKYFIDQISVSIEEIESRHASRLKCLAFLIDSSATCTYDVKVKLLIENWFIEKKQKYREIDSDESYLKSLLKESIKELRKVE